VVWGLFLLSQIAKRDPRLQICSSVLLEVQELIAAYIGYYNYKLIQNKLG